MILTRREVIIRGRSESVRSHSLAGGWNSVCMHIGFSRTDTDDNGSVDAGSFLKAGDLMAKHHNQTILVTGATGHQGGAALRHLREAGFAVRAFTRHPEEPEARHLAASGTEIFEGDLNNEASFRRALDGVQGVFSVQDSAQ